MIRALVARNPALRGMTPWLMLMLVGAQVVTGVYGLVVYKTQHMTYTPLMIGAWILLAIYLTWGQAKHRCSRFDLALPLAARDLWSASVVGSLMAGVMMLAMVLGVVAAVFYLAESLDAFDTLRGKDMLRVGSILLAAVVLGVAWVHSRQPGLAGARGGLWTSLGVFGSLLTLLGPMLLLRDRPSILVPLLLVIAVVTIITTRGRVTSGYVLSPLDTVRKGAVRDAGRSGSGAVARPARGLRANWLHYLMVVRSAPKGPALLVLATPFLLLFGALLSGLLQKLMPDSDLRFAYLPLTAYMCLAFVAPVLANLRMVDALPIGRRYLLLLITLPPLVLLIVGYLGGVIWLGTGEFEMPSVIFSEEDEGYGVRVPTFMWRMSWGGEVPTVVSPTGESHPVTTIPVIKGATPVVYKPYTTPVGSSREYVAWQIWRAAQALHGSRQSPEEIADRFLWTDFEGRVRLKDGELDLRGGGWAVSDRQPGPFFPTTVALVSLFLYLGIAFYAPAIRAGVTKNRRQARMWIILGGLLLLHMAPHILAITRVARPWVLEMAYVDLMMKIVRAVPGGYTGVWIAALLVGVAAFEMAAAAFKKVESPVQRDTCLWDNLSKGE